MRQTRTITARARPGPPAGQSAAGNRRRMMAGVYDEAFRKLPGVILPRRLATGSHSFHLYAMQLEPGRARMTRDDFIEALRAANIGASVHFIPLHRHPLYRDRFGYSRAQFPVAERIFEGLVSLPLYPRMTDEDIYEVVEIVRELLS